MVRYPVALGCLALALTASAAAATQRDSLIRPGVGIGKVKLGMTIAQVRAAWGPARARTLETQPRGSREIELQYDFAAYTVRLVGRPKRERVVSVATTLRREKTHQGVGVGPFEQRLRRQIPGRAPLRSSTGRPRRSGLPARGDLRGSCAPLHTRRPEPAAHGLHEQDPPSVPVGPPPIADWLKLARVMEVVIRAPGAPGLQGEQG